jgi:hypothetical protein
VLLRSNDAEEGKFPQPSYLIYDALTYAVCVFLDAEGRLRCPVGFSTHRAVLVLNGPKLQTEIAG